MSALSALSEATVSDVSCLAGLRECLWMTSLEVVSCRVVMKKMTLRYELIFLTSIHSLSAKLRADTTIWTRAKRAKRTQTQTT